MPKRWAWLKRPRGVSGPVVFAIFAILVIINLFVLIAYTNHSKRGDRLASSDELIAHLTSTLYLMQISPQEEWPRIASVSQTPELTVELTKEPLWSLQMREKSLGQLNHIIQKIPEKLAVSIRLENGKWINFKYTQRSYAGLLQIFIITLGLVVAIALLFSMWSNLRFSVPLRAFKKAAEQLGLELRSSPVIENGPSIVRETAYAMNQMQTRIRNLLQDRNRMLAAISHDLRTPITRLKLRAQFFTDADQYKEFISDLDEMELMIDQILTYTKDASSYDKPSDIDIVALLLSLSDEKCEQGYQVECVTHISRLAYKGRPLALKRAFTNVLNNAIKYANTVLVTIDREDNNLVITIDDDGPGIPEDQLQKVFTAFYRVDSSRSAKTGGSGLGLAIAQDVIHAHQGSILLQNRPAGGLQVKIILAIPPTNS